MSDRTTSLRIFAAGAVLVGSVAVFLYTRQFADPPGTNGFYYLKQIETLAAGEGFFYQDHSLAFVLPAALANLLPDALDAFRLAIGLTWSLLIAGIVALSHRLSKQVAPDAKRSSAIALAALALALSSLTLFELAFVFYKNLFGITLAVWGLLVLHRPGSETLPGKVLAAGLFGLALLSHKSVFLLVAVLLISFGIHRWSRARWWVLTAAIGSSLLVFVGFYAKGSAYLLSLLEVFDAPGGWLAWLGFVVRVDPAVALLIGASILAVGLYLSIRSALPEQPRILFDALAVLLLLSLHPFQKAGPSWPGYRLLIVGPVFVVPLVLTCTFPLRRASILGAVCVALMIAQVVVAGDRPRRHFTNWSALNEQIAVIGEWVKPGDYLISHHGMECYIGYQTGLRSKQYLPDRPVQRVFRVAYVPDGWLTAPARDELEMRKLAQIGEDYVLIREEDWQDLLRAHHVWPHWKNPNTHRPAHVHQ